MTIKKINNEVVVVNTAAHLIDALVTMHGSASLAMLAVAERFGIAVNYMDRGVIEGHIGRPLTDEEWVKLAYCVTDGYDQRIDDTWNVSDVQSEFVHEACRKAGVDIEGGE